MDKSNSTSTVQSQSLAGLARAEADGVLLGVFPDPVDGRTSGGGCCRMVFCGVDTLNRTHTQIICGVDTLNRTHTQSSVGLTL